MTQTPASVSDQLYAELHHEFSEPQLVELATAIAWENHRARFNRAFGVSAEGFSKGAFCPLPAQGLEVESGAANPGRGRL